MNIAVVGCGIFGSTVSWYLAKSGFNVDLYEKEDDIFKAASGINQYRIHRGYHYPRSIETMLTCKKGEIEFKEVYNECIIDSAIEHYYCIAKKGSLISSEECSNAWDDCGLNYTISSPQITKESALSESFKVSENLFDHKKLKSIILNKIKKYDVNLKLNSLVNYNDLKEYDKIVIATYSNNNFFLKQFPFAQREYQYELCEKLVLKLPKEFKNKSVVIMDGPFTCIDPFGNTGFHVMGNVVHAIHYTTIGKSFDIPKNYKSLLNNGVIKKPHITNFDKFIKTATKFFIGIEEAEHIGSMYTIRTVLPFRDHDDSRPTIVEQINEKIITVFSGKIPTCIDSANQILRVFN